jgi:hypothetical protein
MQLAIERERRRVEDEAVRAAQQDAQRGYDDDLAANARVTSELIRRSNLRLLKKGLDEQADAHQALKRKLPHDVLCPTRIARPVDVTPFVAPADSQGGVSRNGVRSISALGSNPDDWLHEKRDRFRSRKAYGKELDEQVAYRSHIHELQRQQQRDADRRARDQIVEDIQNDKRQRQAKKAEHRSEFVEAWDTQRSVSSMH